MDKKGRSAKTVGVFKQAAKIVGAKPKVSQEDFYRRVAHKAYELYISRGAGHGNDQADWLEAERLVRAELGR
jgi:hypothetical protein